MAYYNDDPTGSNVGTGTVPTSSNPLYTDRTGTQVNAGQMGNNPYALRTMPTFDMSRVNDPGYVTQYSQQAREISNYNRQMMPSSMAWDGQNNVDQTMRGVYGDNWRDGDSAAAFQTQQSYGDNWRNDPGAMSFYNNTRNGFAQGGWNQNNQYQPVAAPTIKPYAPQYSTHSGAWQKTPANTGSGPAGPSPVYGGYNNQPQSYPPAPNPGAFGQSGGGAPQSSWSNPNNGGGGLSRMFPQNKPNGGLMGSLPYYRNNGGT